MVASYTPFVALQNSSLKAAKKSIEHYKLDPTIVKPYGLPEELAEDERVDLVVVGTRVDVHYQVVKGLLEGWKSLGKGVGKGVYCEWPLPLNLAQVNELVALAEETRVRTVVGT